MGLQPPPLLIGQGSAGRRTPTGLLRSDGSVLFDSPVFSVTPQPMTGSRTPHFVVNLAEVRPLTRGVSIRVTFPAPK